ncbi:hypothetical protein AT246_07565 [Bartonella henselae]|nr:hypothetical protein AT247_05935 [Bartonella henselae]OLL51422.1 hypothetical protein AT241_00100 [Bartonella henselae]OLL52448.1 hypothetical protein AT243_04560 [Bartonella henselae]OLL53551.1 hypothetical protein AT240_02710 [Bartonella henselae]OLL54661.1 hypothetical protein AT239_07325 [Bartonella henselae]
MLSLLSTDGGKWQRDQEADPNAVKTHHTALTSPCSEALKCIQEKINQRYIFLKIKRLPLNLVHNIFLIFQCTFYTKALATIEI